MNVVRVLLFALLTGALPTLAAELPGDSIYQLPIKLTDEKGKNFQFAERRGKPQLISMFYTSCPYVCPLIIDTLKKTQRALAPAKVAVLLVSFDPERDTPKRLQQVFVERKLDAASWTLARTDANDVRQLAAVLDLQYRALANGDINHSAALVLIDGDGRIVARTDKIGEVDADFVAAVRSTLHTE